MDINELKQKYAEEQKNKEQKHPFLLFELAGGKENAHTRALMAILNFKDHLFLPSFLKDVCGLVCGINENESIEIVDQKGALGLKDYSTGYIDLYIKFKDKDNNEHQLVIENKIYGAKDTKNQLNRYIAAIKGINKTGFEEWLNSSKDDDLKKSLEYCHIAYLTLEGGSPSEQSLNKTIKDNIDLIEINYVQDIIPWIRRTVLKECPYHDEGVTIAGLIQYLAALDRLSDKSGDLSEVVHSYVAQIKEPASKQYNEILKTMESIKPQDKKKARGDYEYSDMLWAELKRAAEEIYSHDVDKIKPWVLHFTPSFMCLYKPEWMNIGKGKYSIPFVHFFFPNYISKNQNRFAWEQWKLTYEHLRPTDPGLQDDRFKKHLGNKKKTLGIRLSDLDYIKKVPKPNDLEDQNDRSQYFEDVIKSIQGIAEIVDQSLVEIRNQQLEDDNEIAFKILENTFPKVLERFQGVEK